MGQSGVSLSDRVRLRHLVKPTRQSEILIRLIRDHQWTVGAEIGVLKGKTLFALLLAQPRLTMYAVDQWKHLPLRSLENAETYTDFDMDYLAGAVKRRALDFGTRCRILRGDSVAMADMVSDRELDFVFIDGDHTEFGVTRDFSAWRPKVKQSGYILGHDCDWTSVKRAINRLCPGWINYGQSVWGIPCRDLP